MDSGFGAGRGADMLQEILGRKFREAIAMRELANREAEVRLRNQIAQQQMGLDSRRLDQDTRRLDQDAQEFGFRRERAGVEDQRYDEAAPMRATNLRLNTAQAANLEGLPAREQAARDDDAQQAKTQHGYRMAEIGARSGDSRGSDWQIVQSVNPQTNETVSVRVNRQTGEAQPVQMPGGLQPGGAKQTRLSVSQQDDLATMETVQTLSRAATKLGGEIGWKGVGGMGAGTVGRLGMQHLGVGDPRSEQLRNFVGNIQGTIAKLRGGTAFSAQEKAMLDSYTPTINDDPKAIQAKLASLDTFINAKRESTMKYAGGGSPAPSGGSGFKVVEIK